MNEEKLSELIAGAKLRALEKDHLEVQIFRLALEEVLSSALREALGLVYGYDDFLNAGIASFKAYDKQATISERPEPRQKHWNVYIVGTGVNPQNVSFAFNTEDDFLLEFAQQREQIRRLT